MRSRILRTVTLMLAIATGSIPLIGCASAPKEPAPDDYVFFRGSSNLKRVSGKRGVFLYVNPDRSLRDYSKFIVDSSGIYFQPQSAHWIDKAKSDELAAFFRQAVVNSLSGLYETASSPGRGVLRISLTLGDVRRRQTDSSTTSAGRSAEEFQPVLRILLTDSATGEDVLLLRDITRGSDFAETLEQQGDVAAKELLREWARLLRDKIDEARRTNGQTSQPTRS